MSGAVVIGIETGGTKILARAESPDGHTIREARWGTSSIDDLCRAAGVTKGAFFHHFASKEALGVAAAEYWAATTAALFATAPYHAVADPFDRILAYLDFRRDLIEGDVADFTCLVGTMVQEAYQSSPAIAAACEASISGHAQTLEPDIAAALAQRGMADVDAKSLALFTQAALQGGFILAKAGGGPALARETIAHLKRYFQLLFNRGA